MAEPLVKWATEITRLEDMSRIVHRAAKIAMTPPTGPVFLSLPGDILNNEAGIDLGSATRVDTRNRPSDGVLEQIAERLLQAENPVMICGNEVVTSDAFAEAGAFASALGATVYQQTVPYGAHFLSEHPCFMGGLSRSQKQVRSVLEPFDLMVVVGADVLRMSVWDEVDPMPDGLPIVQIGLNDWEMGKNYPTELAIGSDVRETLKALTPVLKERGGSALADAAATGALANCQGLLLDGNQIGDKGLEVLSSALVDGAMAPGAEIYLQGNNATEAGKQAVRDAVKARGLTVYI